MTPTGPSTPAAASMSTATTTTTTTSSSSSSNMLTDLDDDALAEVVRAAKSAGALVPLATTSKQLCNLSRSRVPVQLRVFKEAEVNMVLQSLAAGRPLSSCCTQLCMRECDLVLEVLSTGPWTALQELELEEGEWCDEQQQQAPRGACDHRLCAVMGLQALQHLRVLYLNGPYCYGACTAQRIGQMVQLTRLMLDGDSAAAAADLTDLSRLTNLRELVLFSPPVVQPAAGPDGPFSLPTSVTQLVLERWGPIGCWVTHLAGCPQLQELQVTYRVEQHPSAHPGALVSLLAQHNQHLRTFSIKDNEADEEVTWDASVEGLPDGVAAAAEWRPTADLAALTGLESLWVEQARLSIKSAADWHHLAQLSALTWLSEARIYSPPDVSPGPSLSLLNVSSCEVHLSGYDLGRLLLACPQLRGAEVCMRSASPLVVPPPGAPRLPPHTSLKRLRIRGCWEVWDGDDVIQSDAAAVAAHFAEPAPVLSGLSDLWVWGWPTAASVEVGVTGALLPDLSPCTALSAIDFNPSGRHAAWEQEDFLSMLAPLQQLQRLDLWDALGVTARLALVLQHMLPRLRFVRLWSCGQLLPMSVPVQQQGAAAQQEQQQAAAQQLLHKVRQLLRPGLVLELRS